MRRAKPAQVATDVPRSPRSSPDIGLVRVEIVGKDHPFVYEKADSLVKALNNIFDREYIGAVIVGDANGRYFAPAPTRNFLVGVSASYTF